MVEHIGQKPLSFIVHLTVDQNQNEQMKKKKTLKFYEIVIVICCMAMGRRGIVRAFIELIEENLFNNS